MTKGLANECEAKRTMILESCSRLLATDEGCNLGGVHGMLGKKELVKNVEYVAVLHEHDRFADAVLVLVIFKRSSSS